MERKVTKTQKGANGKTEKYDIIETLAYPDKQAELDRNKMKAWIK